MTSEDLRDLMRYMRERVASGEATVEGMRLMLSTRTDLDETEKDSLLDYFKEQLSRLAPRAEVIELRKTPVP